MFGLFKKKTPKTLLDDVNSATAEMFRPFFKNNKSISDEKIVEIVQTVMRAFKEAAESKSETIPGTTLIDISSHFAGVYDLSGHEFFMEHLEYEINLYLTSGLREKWGGKSSANSGGAQEDLNQACEYYEKEDFKQAAQWFRKAAEQGSAQAQSNLGVMYADGEGVDQNMDEAIRWLRKAAEQGYAEYQHNLGVMYVNGEDIDKNFDEAAKWLRKSAEQNYADAQHLLGVMYMRGDGVDNNLEEAIKWLKKAAEQGHAEALQVLTRLANTIGEQK